MGEWFTGGHSMFDSRIFEPSVTLTSSDGSVRDAIYRTTTYNPDAFASSIDIPSMWPSRSFTELDWYKLNGIDVRSEEEIPKMKTYKEKDPYSCGNRYAVACSHAPDLAQDRILKSLSMMKSKLMMQCAPVKVENIECKMTPAVKENIIMAYKKLEMYGKKTPFVARFDEFGRRLPDEIKIDVMRGMTIKIVDPDDYNPYYIEFEGKVHDPMMYKPGWDYGYKIDPEDVPF